MIVRSELDHFLLIIFAMLSRFVFGITRRVLRTNFLVVSSRSTSDGDHTRSKAKEKAAEDLKTRQEQRWLDTVASDSGETLMKMTFSSS